MAKAPRPGQVKTRLVDDGYSPDAAARAATAMLRCITDRLRRRGPVVLAVSPDGAGDDLRAALGGGISDIPIIDQGEGNLGDRMERVWRRVNADAPVAFFGMDSPDIPDRLLDEIPPLLRAADAAIGPTDDGGIWTLAAHQPTPALLASIDWGSERVYDQMRQRAEQADIALASLSGWFDIDRAEDISAMVQRLRNPDPGDQPDAALQNLLEEMETLAAAARE